MLAVASHPRFLLLNLLGLGAAVAVAFLLPHGRCLAVLGVILLYGVVLIRGATHRSSALLCRVRSRGADRTKLALTFEDGPGDATRQVLALLAANQVKATFFISTENVKGREDVIRAIAGSGHTIGSRSRSSLACLTGPVAARALLERNVEAIASVMGKRPRFHRASLKGPALGIAAQGLGLLLIGWRAGGGDAPPRDKGSIVSRLLRARGGDVLLLHDGLVPGETGSRQATLEALREVLPLLRSRGFGFATVDQLLGERAYS